MIYRPSYSKEKLDILRRYVDNYIEKFESKAASAITEGYNSIISRRPTDGDSRYKFFNNLFFNGDLPNNVKVYFTNDKNKSRSTGFNTETRRNGYKEFNDKKNNALGEWFPTINTIYIHLVKLNNDDFTIDSVLVHEMCHVWQDKVYKGNNNISSHGTVFQNIRDNVDRESRGVYNIGAFVDPNEVGKNYRKGKFRNPVFGKTSDQANKIYIDKLNKKLSKYNLKVFDLDNKIFIYNNAKYKFENGKIISMTNRYDVTDSIFNTRNWIAENFSKNRTLIGVLNDAYRSIKYKRNIV